MVPSDSRLLRALQDSLSAHSRTPALWLGLSGGLDSMLLLDLLAELAASTELPPLRAVHVHHGLSPLADQWAELCARACARHGVPLQVERVVLASQASIEEAARQARYAVYQRLLGAGELLLLAQHADDQLETLLFRALRGTGLRGLVGMPRQRPLGQGQLLRPLLDFTRAELEVEARRRNLQWVVDPANSDPRFARSWLRHTALPTLRRQWPQVDRSLWRLAGHAAEACELLDEMAQSDLQQLSPALADPWLQAWPSIPVAGLRVLSAPRQRNLLRYWLQQHTGLAADQRHLQTLQQQLQAADDRQPCWRLADVQLQLSVGRLWLLSAAGMPAGQAQPLSCESVQVLRAGNGVLRQHGQRPQGNWRIAYRQGGEVLALGRLSKPLKQLFQEASIPVWLRPGIPLIYRDEELLSVAGRWNHPRLSEQHSDWSLEWLPQG